MYVERPGTRTAKPIFLASQLPRASCTHVLKYCHDVVQYGAKVRKFNMHHRPSEAWKQRPRAGERRPSGFCHSAQARRFAGWWLASQVKSSFSVKRQKYVWVGVRLLVGATQTHNSFHRPPKSLGGPRGDFLSSVFNWDDALYQPSAQHCNICQDGL